MINKDDSVSQQDLMSDPQQLQVTTPTTQPNGFHDSSHNNVVKNGGNALIYTDFGEYPIYKTSTYPNTPLTDDRLLMAVKKKAKWNDGPTVSGSTMSRGGKHSNRRLVYKNGECNVSRANIKKRRQRYMADIFTTLVDIKWRWNLLNFVLAFILSWMIFALAWWLICFSHGDFDSYVNKEGRESRKPCIEEVYDFTTALLFSIETQQTIGFGSRRMNPYCPEAILVMMCQSCFGVIIQALMTGLVFAKLSRPKKRAETLLFSKNAIVCKRDGQLCLLFRVGDMRKSHIVEAHVRAILIRKRVTQEGEVIPLYQYDLPLGDVENGGRLFMVWPVIVEHRITETSPLWTLSAEDLQREQFELVVVLEGIVESTGMTTQARTSYLPCEILWGHRFERLVSFQKESSQYLIDYSLFHSTVSIDIPQCSARDLDELRRSGETTEADEEGDDETMSMQSDPLASSGRGSATTGKLAGDERRRIFTPQLTTRSNGINGVALAAFDLHSDDTNFQSLNDCSSVAVDDNSYRYM